MIRNERQRVTRGTPEGRAPRRSGLMAVLAIGVAMAIGGVGGAVGAAVDLDVAVAVDVAVLPTVSVDAGADTSVLEGSALSRAAIVVDGEDNGALGWTYSVDYGDGGGPVTGATLLPRVDLDHVYADGPAMHTVTVIVTDEPGESAVDTVVITVANVAPIPVLVGATTTDEGATYSLTLSAIDPAGVYDPPGFTIDWGDGTISVQVLRPAGTYTHVFADDDDGPLDVSTRNIRVSVFDDESGVGQTFPVLVGNVAPRIPLSGQATARVATPYTLTLGAVADPGRDIVSSRVIHWGDGSTEIVAGSGDVTHTYAVVGAVVITVDLVDDDGTFVAAGTLPVTVALDAPTAPTGVLAVARSKSSVLLSWTNTSTTQTAVDIERCKGAGCTGFTRVATVAGTATSFTDGRLSPRTSYAYRIRARNSAGSSPYSVTATVTTPR